MAVVFDATVEASETHAVVIIYISSMEDETAGCNAIVHEQRVIQGCGAVAISFIDVRAMVEKGRDVGGIVLEI